MARRTTDRSNPEYENMVKREASRREEDGLFDNNNERIGIGKVRRIAS
jgi:hypothetical protein